MRRSRSCAGVWACSVPDAPRIAIAGAGSIGCFVGGVLMQAGFDLRFLARSRLIDAVADTGLHLTGYDGLNLHLTGVKMSDDLLEHGTPAETAPSEADLHDAMLAGRILAHAQGFRVLSKASEEFEWSLDMARIAEIWRAGCIIRSALLDEFADAFRGELPHGHMILAPAMVDRLRATLPGLRRVVAAAVLAGQPVPALSAALSWHDSMGHARGTADMIQGLRDFFGNHGFERLDRDGDHHGSWG